MVLEKLLGTADRTDQIAETEGRVGDVGEQLQELFVSGCVAEFYQSLLEKDVRDDRRKIERAAVLTELDCAGWSCRSYVAMKTLVEVVKIERAEVSVGLFNFRPVSLFGDVVAEEVTKLFERRGLFDRSQPVEDVGTVVCPLVVLEVPSKTSVEVATGSNIGCSVLINPAGGVKSV